jgi:hypothetical protein
MPGRECNARRTWVTWRRCADAAPARVVRGSSSPGVNSTKTNEQIAQAIDAAVDRALAEMSEAEPRCPANDCIHRELPAQVTRFEGDDVSGYAAWEEPVQVVTPDGQTVNGVIPYWASAPICYERVDHTKLCAPSRVGKVSWRVPEPGDRNQRFAV